jgi:nucleoid-associated protein YgaU
MSTPADQVLEMGTHAVTPGVQLDYWHRLIAANGDRLVDAGNPDLLYPGQVLVLPPLT